VALGMRAAVRMSMAGGLLSARDAMRVEMLLSCIGLPQRIRGASPEKILKGMRFDKKFSGKKNRFVLAKGIGRAVVVENIAPELVSALVRGLFRA
jgi:3-dehydroquinate synthase